MKKVLMVFLSVFMAMSLSVGIGLFVGKSFNPQQAEAAESENNSGISYIDIEKPEENIKHYLSNSIDNLGNTIEANIEGDYSKSEFGFISTKIRRETSGTLIFSGYIEPGIKITGYSIHYKTVLGNPFATVSTINNDDFNNTTNDNRYFEIAFSQPNFGIIGISIAWFQTPIVKYGFNDENDKTTFLGDKEVNKYGSLGDVSNYNSVDNDTKYKFNVIVNSGYMLHSVEYDFENTEYNDGKVEWEKNSKEYKIDNKCTDNNSIEISGDKYANITVSGISKFPKYIRIVFRKSNQVTFNLLIEKTHHSAIKFIDNANYQTVFSGGTGIGVGEINNSNETVNIKIGDMNKDSKFKDIYNSDLGLFGIGYTYKVYYQVEGSDTERYLDVSAPEDGNIVKVDDKTFKACSDLKGYDYVNVQLNYSLINSILKDGSFSIYLKETGQEIKLNSKTMSDELVGLGQYKLSSAGGTVTETDNKNLYKLSSSYGNGYDFSALNIDNKNIGYVTFNGSDTIIKAGENIKKSNENGKSEDVSQNAFMISVNRESKSGEYNIGVHGSTAPFKTEDNDKVYYDNILSAYIQYTYNLYNGYDYVMNLPTGFKIDVYFYFSVKQFTLNGINSVDDKETELVGSEEKEIILSNNRVEVSYNLPDAGGKVIMYEDTYKSGLKVYYGATVNINIMEEYGRRFVGLYYKHADGYELVSVPSQMEQISGNIIYNFQFTFTSVNQIDLVAKYISYTTTTKMIYPTNRVYSISSVEDLVWLSKSVENGNSYEGYVFKQTCNINFAENENLNPIGTVKTPFKGIYDGNGYTISNLKFFVSDDYTANLSNIGLFGCTDGATIRNVNILGGTRNIRGLSNVGGVVGYAKNTTFKFVNNYNANISLKDSSDQYISVELFNFKLEVLRIYDATVENPVMQRFGGVVGFAENCDFTAVACSANLLTNKSYTAGLIGYASGSNIDRSYYDGTRAEIVDATTGSLNCGLVYSGTNGKIEMFNCCVYSQGIATYYRVENNTVKSGEIKSDEEGLYVMIDGAKFVLREWFLLNGRPELKIFYWGY